ncbi:hypothetical protein SCP_1700280 [Sparassis crispa]|uniref:Uncharacterized protein n=1 Tax=Sparassis crispa TaxID=139825 RepID=A0A401H5K9_9APHY|nr:hypothetical protein SCP_1700280 [Sparassis crispa]GBE89704.1 hypothetical protein SCP_1700280 [Sparassis crispa]
MWKDCAGPRWYMMLRISNVILPPIIDRISPAGMVEDLIHAPGDRVLVIDLALIPVYREPGLCTRRWSTMSSCAILLARPLVHRCVLLCDAR